MANRYVYSFVIYVSITTFITIIILIPPAESSCPDCSALQAEISFLKTELQKMKQNFDSINVQVGDQMKNLLSAEVTTAIINVKSEVTQVKQKVDQLQSSVVTDIRMAHPQNVAIWKGPGYVDTVGWVLTGVGNWNWDNFPDTAYRRAIQKKVNGNWITVSG